MLHVSRYTTRQQYVSTFFSLRFVGLFNALTGLGGGGQVDPTISAKANTALYATFSVGAFFSG